MISHKDLLKISEDLHLNLQLSSPIFASYGAVSQLGHTERVFIASLSPAGFGNRRAARGRSSGVRSSCPGPAPKTQAEVAAVRRVSAGKKGGSLRSAFAPPWG
jgi:hypothetical protein